MEAGSELLIGPGSEVEVEPLEFGDGGFTINFCLAAETESDSETESGAGTDPAFEAAFGIRIWDGELDLGVELGFFSTLSAAILLLIPSLSEPLAVEAVFVTLEDGNFPRISLATLSSVPDCKLSEAISGEGDADLDTDSASAGDPVPFKFVELKSLWQAAEEESGEGEREALEGIKFVEVSDCGEGDGFKGRGEEEIGRLLPLELGG